MIQTLPLVGAVLVVASAASATSLLGEIATEHDRVEAVVRDASARLLADAPLDPARLVERLPEGFATALGPALHFAAVSRLASPERARFSRQALAPWRGGHGERVRAHVDATDAARVASTLLRDDRHNRWAAAVNDAIRPFGLGTNLLAVVNPILLAGSALDSVWSTAAHVRSRDRTSIREHQALVAYRRAVADAPGGRIDPFDARAAARLDSRVRRAQCRRLVADTKQARDDHRLLHAAYLTRSPAAAACDAEIATVRRDVERSVAQRVAALEASRWPVTAPSLPRTTAEWATYESLAAAAVAPDPAATLARARTLRAAYPDGPNGRGAQLVSAAAHRLADRPDDARQILETLDRGSAALVARSLRATLPDAEAAAVDAAERRHAREVARYVLVGGGPSGRGVLRSAVRGGAQGLASLPVFGITNAIGILTRGFLAWRRDPASNDEVIAEGETYLARHPTGTDATKVRERLVRAYERSERWDRALMHYQALPSPDPGEIRRFENAIADQMLRRAAATPEDPSLLRAVVGLYPGSPAAERARTVRDARDGGAGVVVPRDVLEEVPWLLGSTGLGLPPGLLDGKPDNGELHDDGIRVTHYAIECTMRDGDGRRTETIALGTDDQPRVFATLAEIARIHRANHADDEDDDRSRWSDWIPFFLQGSVGDSGVSVHPGIKLRPDAATHPERYR